MGWERGSDNSGSEHPLCAMDKLPYFGLARDVHGRPMRSFDTCQGSYSGSHDRVRSFDHGTCGWTYADRNVSKLKKAAHKTVSF